MRNHIVCTPTRKLSGAFWASSRKQTADLNLGPRSCLGMFENNNYIHKRNAAPHVQQLYTQRPHVPARALGLALCAASFCWLCPECQLLEPRLLRVHRFALVRRLCVQLVALRLRLSLRLRLRLLLEQRLLLVVVRC